MGGSKTYNLEHITPKAMELFWSPGYEATSTKALAGHMGATPTVFSGRSTQNKECRAINGC